MTNQNNAGTPTKPVAPATGNDVLDQARKDAQKLIDDKKAGRGPAMTADGEFASPLEQLGTISQWRAKNGYMVSSKVQASKASQLPTLYFRDNDNKVVGVILSQAAGVLHPIGATIGEHERDNLYVQQRVMEGGELGLIITTGGTIEWE